MEGSAIESMLKANDGRFGDVTGDLLSMLLPKCLCKFGNDIDVHGW
jgi:hypothetical protein